MSADDTPTRILRDQHRNILKVADVLEEVLSREPELGALDFDAIADCASFIRLYADALHHGKEEDLLFPEMAKAGIPKEGGPLGVMLREHVEGRNFVKAMGEAAAALKKGDREAGARFARNARGYGALLTQHIFKEDNILYPMADGRLSDKQQDRLAACFAEVEDKVIGHGRHEAYHRLLKELEAVYLG